jgi:hypothetical protein
MRHDQLAKTLITTFFADFLCLAAPESAHRLRLGDASFLDKELFTDQPTGNRREPDLLAQVPTEDSAMILLVHVEIESRARGEWPSGSGATTCTSASATTFWCSRSW